MTSNYYLGASSNQNSNVLTYSMKGLNINSPQPHPLELGAGVAHGGMAHPYALNRSLVSTSGEGGFRSSIRAQASRNNTPDVWNSPIVANAVRNPALTGNGPAILNSMFASPNNAFKTGLSKVPDADMLSAFRTPGGSQSASRVLSNLNDPNQMAFNSNMPSNSTSSFILSRFGSSGADRFSVDGPCIRADGLQSDLSQSPATTGGFENVLSTPQSFAVILPSPNKISLPSFQSQTLTNSSLGVPPMKPASVDVSTTSKPILGQSRSNFASQYYTDRQLESTRDLQASGTLKAANWILVPPVPEGTAAHMRTGRVHEIKSRACTDRVFNSSCMDHELKQVLQNKVQACLFTSDDSTKEKLPRNLGAYTDLVPLELLHQPRVSVTFGFPTVCFKAWSPRFNRPMLLRRVILPVDHEAALSPSAYLLAKQLSDSDHPAVVGFRDVFFTNAFSDNSAVVVYEYAPCSSTIQQTHMCDPMKLTSFSSPFNISRTVRPHSSLKSGASELGMLPETAVWSYLVQLVHGLRFIHQQIHRACGVLDPTKILIQDGTRLRINCFGLKDILFHQSQESSNLVEDQANDFVQLGKLVIGAACGTAESVQSIQRATLFNLLQRTYRPELVALLRGLISGQITGIDQLVRATAPFAYDQLTINSEHSDFLERQLFLSMECDRLFRLVCKLQSIVERNDRNSSNPDWSETGDRYMLKLFRDFVFHQTDHLGAPYLDLAHVISTLNKVEAGSTDRLCLLSRDSQNAIIVTYSEIKQWLESSFTHLVERHRQSRCELQLAQHHEARQQLQQLQHQSQVSQQTSSVASPDSVVAANESASEAGLVISQCS